MNHLIFVIQSLSSSMLQQPIKIAPENGQSGSEKNTCWKSGCHILCELKPFRVMLYFTKRAVCCIHCSVSSAFSVISDDSSTRWNVEILKKRGQNIKCADCRAAILCYTANCRHLPDAVSMLGQSRTWWTNMKQHWSKVSCFLSVCERYWHSVV